jgi:hypothetical protein
VVGRRGIEGVRGDIGIDKVLVTSRMEVESDQLLSSIKNERHTFKGLTKAMYQYTTLPSTIKLTFTTLSLAFIPNLK